MNREQDNEDVKSGRDQDRKGRKKILRLCTLTIALMSLALRVYKNYGPVIVGTALALWFLLVALILLALSRKKKGAGQGGRSLRRDEADGTGEAVRSRPSTGKEKYLEQLDSFLANGIIDRDEYALMKERYSKLDIEDSYH